MSDFEGKTFDEIYGKAESTSSEAGSQFDFYTQKEPDWTFSALDRISRGFTQTAGTLYGGLGLLSDAVGSEEIRDWSIDKAREKFEEAADYDLQDVEFSSIRNPVDAGKWLFDGVMTQVPQFILGGASGLLGRAVIGKAVEKTAQVAINKALAETLKEGTTKTTKEAIKKTAGKLGGWAGLGGYTGAVGGGSDYLNAVDLHGADKADPYLAGLSGAGQAALTIINPLNKLLLGLGKGSALGMGLGEMAEEMGQETISMMHSAGIDPDKTVGDIIATEEGALRLLESGILGAFIGGGVGKLANLGGTKEDGTPETLDNNLEWQENLKSIVAEREKLEPINNPDKVIEEAGISFDPAGNPTFDIPEILPDREVGEPGKAMPSDIPSVEPSTLSSLSEARTERAIARREAEEAYEDSYVELPLAQREAFRDPEVREPYQKGMDPEFDREVDLSAYRRGEETTYDAESPQAKELPNITPALRGWVNEVYPPTLRVLPQNLAERKAKADAEELIRVRQEGDWDTELDGKKFLSGTKTLPDGAILDVIREGDKYKATYTDPRGYEKDFGTFRTQKAAMESLEQDKIKSTKVGRPALELKDEFYTPDWSPEETQRKLQDIKYSLIKKFGDTSLDYDQAISQGFEEASRSFEPKKGTTFEGRIFSRAQAAISKQLRDKPQEVSTEIQKGGEGDSVRTIGEDLQEPLGTATQYTAGPEVKENQVSKKKETSKQVEEKSVKEVEEEYSTRDLSTFTLEELTDLENNDPANYRIIIDRANSELDAGRELPTDVRRSMEGEVFEEVNLPEPPKPKRKATVVRRKKLPVMEVEDEKVNLDKLVGDVSPIGEVKNGKKYVADNLKLNMKERALWNLMQEGFSSELERLKVYDVPSSIIGDTNTAGVYTSGDHIIQINNDYDGELSKNHIVLHEMVHAITAERLMTNKEYSKKMHNIFDEYLRQTTHYGSRYADTNIYEFIAEGMTNPEFQKELASIEYRGTDKSLWTAFTEIIQLLWKPLKENSLLNELYAEVLNPQGKYDYTQTNQQWERYNEQRMSSIREELLNLENSAFSKGMEKYGPIFEDMADELEGLNFANIPEMVAKVRGRYDDELLDNLLDYTDASNRSWKSLEGGIGNSMAIKEAPKKKTWKEKIDTAVKNDTKDDPKAQLKDWGKSAIDLFKDVSKSVTERLREISPKLLAPIRKMEYSINKFNKEYRDRVDPFIRKYNKLDQRDRLLLDLGLMNPREDYTKKRDEVLKRNGMEKEFQEVQKVLAEIHKEKGKEGLNKYKDLPEYFPRRVKDVRALMETMKGSEDYNLIEAELDKLGENATQADKEKAVKNMIHTGRFPTLALLDPSGSRKRKIGVVSSEWLHHYENSAQALLHHIYESNESIYSHRAFGDVTRGQRVQRRDELGKQLESSKLSKEKRKKLVAEFQAIEDQLDKYDEFPVEGLTEKIVELAPDIDMWKADEIVKSVRARLTEKGMHGPISTVRNLSLASVLGSPTSAITQIGDLAFSIYKHGPRNTVESILGVNEVSAKDLDLAGAMNEFQTEGTAKWLDKVLKVSGLSYMDQFGKNTFMNAAIKKARKQSYEEFSKEWGEVFGNQTEQTYKDIKSGKATENTKFFAFNALSDFQPISLSEMPVKYLTAGNGRIVYALKSYNIKALNTLYREGADLWKKGKTPKERAQGAKRIGHLLLLMTAMGATADELKDFLLGKDAGTFSETVQDNLLKTFLVSKYTLLDGSGKNRMRDTITNIIMPPMNLIDDPLYDIQTWMDDVEGNEDIRTFRNVPWGKLPYSWSSDAEEYRDINNLRKQIVKAVKEDGKSIASQRKEMIRYNKALRELNEPRELKALNHGTLSRARREYLKNS